MGFSIDDKQVKRAGLDYWPHVVKEYYPTWEDYCSSVRNDGVRRMHVFSSKATENFWDAEFAQGDTLLFGREDKGLPVDLAFPENIEVRRWRVPIRREFVRSLNLSVCVGVVLFEAFRQIGVEPRDVLRGGELTIDKV
jgi:tRNA (cytidine/uridine-2'-O-)-methyltransferase